MLQFVQTPPASSMRCWGAWLCAMMAGCSAARERPPLLPSPVQPARAAPKRPATIRVETSAAFDALGLDVTDRMFVFFTSSHCGSCRVMAPVVERLARQAPRTARFVVVDTDTCGAAVLRYQVVGTPTFVTLAHGQELARLVGPQREATLSAMVEALLEHP